MSGKFLTDRDIFKNDIFFRPKEYRLFTLLVGNAVWQKEGILYCGRHLECGQYIRSYRKLQGDLKYLENNIIKYYSLQTIKRLVDKLVQRGRITIEIIELGTLFTVCNYVAYQQFTELKNGAGEQQVNSRGTVGEQQVNKNKHRINIDKHREEKDVQERNVSGIPCDLSVDCEGSYTLNDVPEPPKPETIDQTHIDRYNEIWETHFTEGKITQRANAFSLIAGYKIYLAEMATDEKYKTIEHFLLIVKEAVIKVNDIGKLNGKDNFKGFVQSPVRLLTKGRDGAFWLARVLTNEFDKGDTNGNLKPKHSIPEGKKYDVDPDDDWGAAKIYK